MTDDLEVLAGQVIVGGFDGTTLPDETAARLARGHLAGVTLFARNITDVYGAASLCREALRACPNQPPPVISIDQEGGRVARLKPPFPRVPPMRWFGALDDAALTARAATLLARTLAAVGVNLDFAPVADVDSNPDNPVIGDRSFGRDPARVARHVHTFITAMQRENVFACAKHFPGHGDTNTDSHLALPRLTHDLARIEGVELVPFRAAFEAGVATVMTAHVVFDALDPGVPATLSKRCVTDLLRGALKFGARGGPSVCFSDDLHMKAVADLHGVEKAALLSIEAGCDGLLVCHEPESQERVRKALVARAQSDEAFTARLREAASRMNTLRAAITPRPSDSTESLRALLESDACREWQAEVERRSA